MLHIFSANESTPNCTCMMFSEIDLKVLQDTACAMVKAADHGSGADTALQGMALKLLLLAESLWKAKRRF